MDESKIKKNIKKYFIDFPQSELYRYVVDGRFHKIGSGWIKYENKEPNSLKAVFEGLAFALSDIENKRLSVSFIEEIHKRCTEGVEKMIDDNKPGKLRTDIGGFQIGGCIGLPNFECKENCKKICADRDIVKQFISRIEKMEKEPADEKTKYCRLSYVPNREESRNNHITIKQYMEKYKINNLEEFVDEICKEHKPRGGNGWGVWTHSPEVCESEFKKCIDEYNRTLFENGNIDLQYIINFIGELEFIHYFRDGNTRTLTTCLMQRLLIQNGYSPICWYDPNIWYYLPNMDTIIKHINYGQKITDDILNGKRNINGFDSSDIPKNDFYNSIVQNFHKKLS